MKTSAPSLASSTDSGTRLCEGMEIIGEVKFTDSMRVETKISGKIFSDFGTLVVGEKGHIQATIEAGFVEIFGTVGGSVTAKHSVQIHARARGIRDIPPAEPNVEHRAVFEGKSQVTPRRTPNRRLPDPPMATWKIALLPCARGEKNSITSSS